jgi:hypothetical protein
MRGGSEIVDIRINVQCSRFEISCATFPFGRLQVADNRTAMLELTRQKRSFDRLYRPATPQPNAHPFPADSSPPRLDLLHHQHAQVSSATSWPSTSSPLQRCTTHRPVALDLVEQIAQAHDLQHELLDLFLRVAPVNGRSWPVASDATAIERVDASRCERTIEFDTKQ